MNPRALPASTAILFNRLPSAMPVAMTSGVLAFPRTTSSSFITFAGLKKCVPITSCGRLVAEAISSMIRTSSPRLWLGDSGDELTTAQAYREAAYFVPRVGAMMDAVHRHHLVSTRMFIESVERGPSVSVRCGVGFADLSGFTALTQTLTPAELSAMLSEFGDTVSDVVHADGGRVVKFLGDAVMWVSPKPERLAKAAFDLVHHPRACEAGLQVRAGLSYGPILTLSGDYFGNAVNLAARLVAAAAPGQILASEEVYKQLPQWPAVVQEPLQLKGFDAPVIAYELGREDS